MGYRRLEEEMADLVLRVLREAGRPLTTREVQAEAEKDKIYPPHTRTRDGGRGSLPAHTATRTRYAR